MVYIYNSIQHNGGVSPESGDCQTKMDQLLTNHNTMIYYTIFCVFACAHACQLQATGPNNKLQISMFHRAFFSSIMDKTPTPALLTQHYISLAC
jgi:hypothetical protein